MSEADRSEDVNDFLKRIRELGEQRDREDEERNRKLESDILQGRKEREARRAERARSLSPSKSNAGTPHSVNTSMQEPPSSPGNLSQRPPTSQRHARGHSHSPIDMSAPSDRRDASLRQDSVQSPSRPSIASPRSPSTSIRLNRSNTLSWQQRPTSRGSAAGRSRPMSTAASENHADRSPGASAEQSSGSDVAISRNDIAQSLGKKEPTYFRQTADRGNGSPAYRKNQTNVAPEGSSASGAMRLPGMAKESSAEPETSFSPPASVRSSSPSVEGSAASGFGSVSGHRFSSSASLSSVAGMRSPLPTMSSQRFEPPSSDSNASQNGDRNSTGRSLAMSPSQGRISPERTERPASPTKGLGGFVQSAMLKRSDSVNKRWSAQASPALSRGNSIASNRSGHDGPLAAVGGLEPPREFRGSREASPVSSSRPGSSQSTLTVTQSQEDDQRSLGATEPQAKTNYGSNDDSVKPAPILRREGSSFPELQKVAEEEKQDDKSPPASPSKRWSPTKSSWLENAINKPDSPKPKSAQLQQPSWMSELNKAKQQRGSIDLGKSKDFKEVATNSLLRSPPMGGSTKPRPLGNLSAGFNTAASSKTKVESPGTTSQTDLPIPSTKASEEPEPVALPGSPSKLDVSHDSKPDQLESAKKPDVSPAHTSSKKKSLEKPAERSSPSVKPKPETPPKKDFTSNLRTRKPSGAKETKEEPEFKNVFGKLKRAQTQNYKAPDELKDNIMRGKAGLNATGGPKPAERKDEFKDSILKKKEGMKGGLPTASTTIRSASGLSNDRGALLPEALAKRQGLTRSGSSLSNSNVGGKSSESLIAAISKSPPKSPESEPNVLSPKKAVSEPSRVQEPAMNGKPGSNFNAALAGIISRVASPMASAGSAAPGNASTTNPNGASLPSEGAPSTLESDRPLNHMTKSRARGPKRRPPTTADQDRSTSPVAQLLQQAQSKTPSIAETINPMANPLTRGQTSSESKARPLANISINHRRSSQPSSPRKPSTSIQPPTNAKHQSPKPAAKNLEPTKTSPQVKPKPTMATDNPTSREPSTSTAQPLSSKVLASPNAEKPVSAPATASDRQKESKSSENNTLTSSVKDARSTWQQASLPKPNGVRSPIKLPTRKDEEAAHEHIGLQASATKEAVGLGIETASNKPQAPWPSTRNLPASPAPSPRSPRSPPLPAKKPASIASRVPSSTLAPQTPPWKSTTSLSPNSEASRILTDSFGSSPACRTKFSIDTQSIISARSSHDGFDKIKTLRKQIFEVAGDGKLLPVPSHQEHILFEEDLYLCTHVFGNATGTRTTEVYLWCGDAVPSSAVEDAQLFCRKVARDNNGKLIILKQGKETANFFQALGGIVVTRRGSSAKGGSPSSSSATYMLCGRRHVGQIAFDEVDYSPSSLSKGFPHIISGPSGKLYLWKGSGSSADELGCAKLIGMDISLTGEIEEVEDGKEPASFWKAFRDGKQSWSDDGAQRHWQLKASSEKFATRLFSVEVEAPRPKSSSSFLWGRRGSAPTNEDEGTMTAVIKETNPFAQSDLDSEGIHVLDAFFEVHVLVPSTSRSLLPTLRAACEFAQEYGILVASAEDRPFVPVSHVVLGRSVPESVKRAFRKWVDTPYERMECVVLPLNESLRAMQPQA